MHVNCTLGSSSFVWFFTWWSYCKILYFSHVARIQDLSIDLVREKVEALFFYTSKHVNKLFFFFFFPIKNLFLNFANILLGCRVKISKVIHVVKLWILKGLYYCYSLSLSYLSPASCHLFVILLFFLHCNIKIILEIKDGPTASLSCCIYFL